MKRLSAIVNTFFSVAILSFITFSITANDAFGQEQESSIREMLIERDNSIKALLGDNETFTEAQREQLKDMINGVIDFEAMGKAALGKEWNTLSSEQQTEFVDLFSEIVRGQSLADLEIYRLKFDFKEVKVDGNKAQVHTETVYKDQPTLVAYSLAMKQGAWHVDDIILDGVSTADGYARSFQTFVRKKGFDALMAQLQKKLDNMNAGA